MRSWSNARAVGHEAPSREVLGPRHRAGHDPRGELCHSLLERDALGRPRLRGTHELGGDGVPVRLDQLDARDELAHRKLTGGIGVPTLADLRGERRQLVAEPHLQRAQLRAPRGRHARHALGPVVALETLQALAELPLESPPAELAGGGDVGQLVPDLGAGPLRQSRGDDDGALRPARADGPTSAPAARCTAP